MLSAQQEEELINVRRGLQTLFLAEDGKFWSSTSMYLPEIQAQYKHSFSIQNLTFFLLKETTVMKTYFP